jgi:exodeoxyribonuclease VII large subunit
MKKSELKHYTVSQINAVVKVAIDGHLPEAVIVRGQIRNWKRNSSGHCYFSLKDDKAVLPAAMWAGQFRSVKFEPEDGMEVLATGRVDVYLPGGKYQFYANKLEPLGVGALQLAFERMKAKLQAEGLFDDSHKRPLPKYPQRIGILTSQTGAAIHDIEDSIFQRWPIAELLLFPVPVQGEGAAKEIARTLTEVNRSYRLDLLIVGRGGGSLEDLWAFNDEVLARAIHASKIPVISAVGHEVDCTVADLAADARASTPTKAGVVAVPDQQEVLDQLDHWQRRLAGRMGHGLDLARAEFKALAAHELFRRPACLVQSRAQQVDEAQTRMQAHFKDRLHGLGRRLAGFYEQVTRLEPRLLIMARTRTIDQIEGRAVAAVGRAILQKGMRLEAACNRLEGLNPRSVLDRGYSITLNTQTGRVVRTPEDLAVGDLLVTELARDACIESRVTRKIDK